MDNEEINNQEELLEFKAAMQELAKKEFEEFWDEYDDKRYSFYSANNINVCMGSDRKTLDSTVVILFSNKCRIIDCECGNKLKPVIPIAISIDAAKKLAGFLSYYVENHEKTQKQKEKLNKILKN